jgi:hypothetical protein
MLKRPSTDCLQFLAQWISHAGNQLPLYIGLSDDSGN